MKTTDVRIDIHIDGYRLYSEMRLPDTQKLMDVERMLEMQLDTAFSNLVGVCGCNANSTIEELKKCLNA